MQFIRSVGSIEILPYFSAAMSPARPWRYTAAAADENALAPCARIDAVIQNGVIITVKKNLRRRTVWTVVIVEVEVHITMDTDLEAISGVCRCAVFKQ